MAEPHVPDAFAAEFDMLLARAGIVLPPDRRAAALAGYPMFRAQIELLHAPRAHTAEPAGIYRLAPMQDEA
jgi:hypothetical protein